MDKPPGDVRKTLADVRGQPGPVHEFDDESFGTAHRLPRGLRAAGAIQKTALFVLRPPKF